MSDPFFDYPEQADDASGGGLVFLPEWTEEDWALLARHAELRPFRAGEEAIRAGETDRSLGIVVEGRLEVLIPRGKLRKPLRLEVCDAGTVVGEQAFIDGQPRSATIRALTDGKLLRLTLDAFDVFSTHHPVLGRKMLFDLARILSLRLRRASQLVSSWMK